jgi:succinyl-CoA synthetase beta subunit
MKIHEYQAKDFFRSYGIPTFEHIICKTPEEAALAYKQLGESKVVVKAQVLTGGRGKAGGVKLATSKEEVIKQAANILSLTIKDYPVEKIMVTPAASIQKEFYASYTIDRNTKSVILILSAEGGVEIEEVAANTPEKIHKFSIDPFVGIPDYLARKFAFNLVKAPHQVSQLAEILKNLYRLLIEKDASLAEINPLIINEQGDLEALDAKMTFDDNALFRHPDVQLLFEPTPEEKVEADAKSKGFSYVHLDGEIGCMVNGAGLAMATVDVIHLYGGTPANFLDIGGSSNPQKIVDAMTLLLSDKNVKVVLINIFGGITRCDDVAVGLIKAFDQVKTDVPVVVRLTGTNEKEGREILKDTHFIVAETMEQAIKSAVAQSRA